MWLSSGHRCMGNLQLYQYIRVHFASKRKEAGRRGQTVFSFGRKHGTNTPHQPNLQKSSLLYRGIILLPIGSILVKFIVYLYPLLERFLERVHLPHHHIFFTLPNECY